MITARRGQYVKVKPEAIPEQCIDGKGYLGFNARSSALVIFPNLHDPKVGTFHRVMFNGTIFKCILDSEVADNN